MIQMMTNKPLMIAPQSLEVISNVEWVEADEKRISAIHDNVAIIPVYGLLTKNASFMSSFFDMTSYEDIKDAVDLSLEDPNVKSILLDIDSPGGEVSGLFDLVDFIYESRNVKPIYAIANDYAFSAAYAIASAATKIFVNQTSGVGSIGVIATHVDISEFDKKEGIKYTTIFAGDKKNDLSLHEPLTDSATADLQKEADRLYGMFIATVARNRNISSAQIRATQAALYYGADSLSLGLADEAADLMMINPFESSAFDMTSLTASINLLPNMYGRTEELKLFPQKSVRSRNICVEERNGVLSLLPTQNPGAPATLAGSEKRKLRSFTIPHIPHDDVVLPEEVQGIRAFGSETELQAMASVITDHLQAMRNRHAITLGLPLYAKQCPRKFDRGTDLHTQSNPLPMCLRPGVLVKVTAS